MSNRADISLLDQHVKSLLERTRQKPIQGVAVLVSDLKRLVEKDDELAFVATAVCALLAELLVGSAEPGIFPNELNNPIDRQEAQLWNELRSLRNACFHPALITPPTHVEHLAQQLQHRDANLGRMLRNDPSQLRSPQLLRVALGLVDELGRQKLRKFKRA